MRRGEIIKIIGDALSNESANGHVGVYSSLEQIIFYDMAKHKDIRRIEEKIDKLMDYLKLELVQEATKIQKKGEQ